MSCDRPLRIGITCYPSVGGSGILASAAGRGARPRAGTRCTSSATSRPSGCRPTRPRIFFHPVGDQRLRPVQVSRLHAAALGEDGRGQPRPPARRAARPLRRAARDGRAFSRGRCCRRSSSPRVVTTLHGTDTTLLGRDPGYGPAIRHALECSDAVTDGVGVPAATRPVACSASTGRSMSSTISSSRARRGARATRCGRSSA